MGLAALSTSLAGDQADAVTPTEGIGELPVLVQHGLEDPMISVDRARETLERFRALGVAPEYHEYPMGHAIGQDSAADLSRWLERVLKLPCAGMRPPLPRAQVDGPTITSPEVSP